MRRPGFGLVVFSGLFALVVTTSVQAQQPCDDASGVLGLFPSAICVNASTGQVGGPVMIDVPPTTVQVPAGENTIDVIQLYNNEFVAPPALTYTGTFSWDTAVDPDSLVFREWVGNFNFSPPQALAITHVNALDPAMAIEPAEFSWVLDANGLATGAQIVDRDVTALPPEIAAIERYHWQFTGFDPGTAITYTKLVTGGTNIPEPGSIWLLLAGLGMSGVFARSWIRR